MFRKRLLSKPRVENRQSLPAQNIFEVWTLSIRSLKSARGLTWLLLGVFSLSLVFVTRIILNGGMLVSYDHGYKRDSTEAFDSEFVLSNEQTNEGEDLPSDIIQNAVKVARAGLADIRDKSGDLRGGRISQPQKEQSSSIQSAPNNSSISGNPKLLRQASANQKVVEDFETSSIMSILHGSKFLLTEAQVLSYNRRVNPGKRIAQFKQGVMFVVTKPGNKSQYIHEANQAVEQLAEFRRKDTGVALIISFRREEYDDLENTSLPEFSDKFDYIIYNPAANPLTDITNGRCSALCNKISSLFFTPFPYTLFVDTDTRFCWDPTEIFEFMYRNPKDLYAALDTRDLVDLSDRPYHVNTGVLAFQRSSGAARLLSRVLTVFIEGNQVSDQLYFQVAIRDGLKSDVPWSYGVLPHNFHYLRCMGIENCMVKGPIVLFHGRIWSQMNTTFCAMVNSQLDKTRAVFANLTNSLYYITLAEDTE